ncbi:MAG TPA: 3-deoxy-8-phosphooctulonate synthase [Sphingomonas sp.]|nr:3-deoxy-8-phosphooctulonate synthase [Sphingomonas sp.]
MRLFDRPVGGDAPLFLIAGPCALESADLVLTIAERLRRLADRTDMLVIFKGSWDKANRTSGSAYRGPGLDAGLKMLEAVKRETGLPVVTDVHESHQVAAVAEVADMLQTPAFLARQTDLVEAVARSGRPANLKKAQFQAPREMHHVLAKARAAAADAGLDGDSFLLCERGTSFGYGNLVTDLRGLDIMAEAGAPVVFDASHSVQLPAGLGASSGGERRYIPLLVRGAVAAGVAGLFIETHPDPGRALSDAANAWPLDELDALIDTARAIDALVKRHCG